MWNFLKTIFYTLIIASIGGLFYVLNSMDLPITIITKSYTIETTGVVIATILLFAYTLIYFIHRFFVWMAVWRDRKIQKKLDK